MKCLHRASTSPVRKYIKGKPHPWEFKIPARADPSGIFYDFNFCQGGDGIRANLGANLVISLTAILHNHVNNQIYVGSLPASL